MNGIDKFAPLTDLSTLKVHDFDKAGVRIQPKNEKKVAKANGNGKAVETESKAPEGAAMAAAKEEAKPEDEKKKVKFDFDGETYEVPPVDEWSVRIFEAQEEGRIVSTVKLLLGPEQWETFMSQPNPKHKDRRIDKDRTLPDMNKLFMAAQEALGFESGD